MSIGKTARIAGICYLMMILTLVVSKLTVHSRLVVGGDAATTAANIVANQQLFRIGFMSDLLSGAFFLVAAWALYVLLRQTDKNLALLFLVLNIAGVAIQCVNTLALFAAFQLLTGSDYMNVFQTAQLQALAMFFIDLNKAGLMIAQVFYGAWLLPLGYLVYKSGLLPRAIGILLIVDCAGVAIWLFQYFLFPDYQAVTYPGLAVSFIAEVSLSLWLLFASVRDRTAAIPAAA